MVNNEYLKRVPLAMPPRTMLETLRRSMLSLSRPRMGGVDIYDLDKRLALGAATFYCVGIVVVFISLLVTLTQNQVQQSFLSLSNDNSNIICDEIPLTVTGKYLATYNGVWNTNNYYLNVENQTAFAMEFFGSTLSTAEYAEVMTGFLHQLRSYAKHFATRALIYNAMFLCNYGFRDAPTSTYFYSEIDADFVFNQEVQVAAISSREGLCDSHKVTGRYISGTYDQATKSYMMRIPLVMDNAYIRNADAVLRNATLAKSLKSQTTCPAQEITYQYISDTNWGEYEDTQELFYFDIRTVAACVAINMGLISLNNFNTISRTDAPGFKLFTDPYYTNPPLSPLWCLDKYSTHFHNFTQEQIAGPEICFLRDAKFGLYNIYYPLLSQYRKDLTHCLQNSSVCRYVLCECPDASAFPECNRQQFTLGFLYLNSNSSGSGTILDSGFESNPLVKLGLKMQQLILQDKENGDLAQSRASSDVLSYTISIAESMGMENIPLTSYWDDNGVFVDNSWANGRSFEELLTEAFDTFCGEEHCAAYVFKTNIEREGYLNRFRVSFSDLLSENGMNPHAQQISCRNIAPKSVIALNNLVVVPPTPLVNSYFQCRRTYYAALVASLGGAVASANFYSSFVWIVLGYVLVRVLRARNRHHGTETTDNVFTAHTKDEVAEVLERLKDDSIVSLLKALADDNRDLRRRLEELDKASAQRSAPHDLELLLKNVERFHRTEQSMDDYAIVGQALSHALQCEKTPVSDKQATIQQQQRLSVSELQYGSRSSALYSRRISIELSSNNPIISTDRIPTSTETPQRDESGPSALL